MNAELSQDKKNAILKVLSLDLTNLVGDLRMLKPDDRSELARRFAIAITESEKLDAYIAHYILNPLSNVSNE